MFGAMNDSPPNLDDVENATRNHALSVFGLVPSRADDPVPEGTQTIVLLGPSELGFWAHVSNQPEFRDGRADQLDRWSRRIIRAMASDFGGTAIFPFGGPPYAPFIGWALRSGRAWSSPVTLLVHDTAGLMVSYRGAIAVPFAIKPPAASTLPCDTCAGRPCLAACPVNALTSAAYDLAACHGFLDSPAGHDCMNQGCAVRRACPVSHSYGRLPQQSAHHMKAFHP